MRPRHPHRRAFARHLAPALACVLAARCLAACSAPPQDAVYSRGHGAELSDADHAIIIQAADAWCEATAGACCPDDVPVEAHPAEDCHDPKTGSQCGGRYIRYPSTGEHEIWIIAELLPDTRDLYGVALHEYGHACGYRGHSDDPDSTMFSAAPAAEPGSWPTADAIRAIIDLE